MKTISHPQSAWANTRSLRHIILIVHVRVDLNFEYAPHREIAIGTGRNLSVARDERYLTRALLRRRATTYGLHCIKWYSLTSRLTQQQYCRAGFVVHLQNV